MDEAGCSTPYTALETDDARNIDRVCSRRDSVLLSVGAAVTDRLENDEDHIQHRIDELKSPRNKLWTLIFVSLGIGCTVCSNYVQSDSIIPVDPSYALLSIALSTCIVITGLWKLLQLISVYVCCTKSESLKCCRLILVPGWAIWFLFMSMCLTVLCVFGFITYSSEISYSFGVSMIFGISSFILFIVSTFGLYRYCGCCRVFLVIWQYISFYVCVGFVIWDIVSDVLAATKVYVHEDYKFFSISVAFTTITFFLYWVLGIGGFCLIQFGIIGDDGMSATDIATFTQYFGSETKMNRFFRYWKWTLCFPILSMITITVYVPGSSMIALAFSSFPQYVVSLSFIIENKVFDTWNVMALIMSLLQLLSSPLMSMGLIGWAVYKIMPEEEKKLKNIEVVKGKHMAGVGFAIFLFYMIFFVPIVLLEVIHFCPILFEYYYYKGMSYDEMVTYILIFNFPKLLFLGITIDEKGSGRPLSIEILKLYSEGIIDTNVDLREKAGGTCLFFLGLIVYALVFMVLPLIPVTLISLGAFVVLYGSVIETVMDMDMDSGEINTDATNLARLVRQNGILFFLYLAVAYGYMGRMLMDYQIGEVSKAMLFTTWGLSAWLLILPLLIPLGGLIAMCIAYPLVKEYDKDFNEEEMGKSSGHVMSLFIKAFYNSTKMMFKLVLCPCCIR